MRRSDFPLSQFVIFIFYLWDFLASTNQQNLKYCYCSKQKCFSLTMISMLIQLDHWDFLVSTNQHSQYNSYCGKGTVISILIYLYHWDILLSTNQHNQYYYYYNKEKWFSSSKVSNFYWSIRRVYWSQFDILMSICLEKVHRNLTTGVNLMKLELSNDKIWMKDFCCLADFSHMGLYSTWDCIHFIVDLITTVNFLLEKNFVNQ